MTCPAIYPRKSVQGLANTGDRKTPAFLTDSEAYGPAPKAAETQRTPSRLQGPQGTGTVNAKRREAGPRPGGSGKPPARLLPPASSRARQAGLQSGWKPGCSPPRGVRSPRGPRRGRGAGLSRLSRDAARGRSVNLLARSDTEAA